MKWFTAIRDNWRQWRSVRATYNLTLAELHHTKTRVAELERQLKRCTTLGADIGCDPREGNWVILVGRYHNRDYVETFALNGSNFHELVQQVQHLARHAGVTRIDAPPGIKAVVERRL